MTFDLQAITAGIVGIFIACAGVYFQSYFLAFFGVGVGSLRFKKG